MERNLFEAPRRAFSRFFHKDHSDPKPQTWEYFLLPLEISHASKDIQKKWRSIRDETLRLQSSFPEALLDRALALTKYSLAIMLCLENVNTQTRPQYQQIIAYVKRQRDFFLEDQASIGKPIQADAITSADQLAQKIIEKKNVEEKNRINFDDFTPEGQERAQELGKEVDQLQNELAEKLRPRSTSLPRS